MILGDGGSFDENFFIVFLFIMCSDCDKYKKMNEIKLVNNGNALIGNI